MIRQGNVTQIPTMMNGIYYKEHREKIQYEMIERIAYHVAKTRQLVLIICAIIALVGTVHVYETIKFNNIVQCTTIDCISESRGY